jgi:hypothetical protein
MYKWITGCFILISVAAVVYSLSGEPHQFSSGECRLCHFDEKEMPMNLKTNITNTCETCHSELQETPSHPTDIYPDLPDFSLNFIHYTLTRAED